MENNPHLTKGTSKLDTAIALTYPGQAGWATWLAPEKTCRECKFFKLTVKTYGGKGRCLMAARLAHRRMKKAPPFPADAYACSRFEPGKVVRLPNPKSNLKKETSTMPDFRSSFGGKYFRAEDLDQPIIGEIASVEMETVNEKDGTRRPVMRLAGISKGVVMNTTRYDFVSHLVGTPNTDDWLGRRILVRRGQTNFGGKRVACVELGHVPAEESIDGDF